MTTTFSLNSKGGTFLGYRRDDGRVGLRNYVLVMSSVSCANGVVDAVGRACPQVKTITHPEGCGRAGEDVRIALRTLIGLGQHPNVAAVIVIGLGCEVLTAPVVGERIREMGKKVVEFSIQDVGGTPKATAKGIEIATELLEEVNQLQREEASVSELVIGLECGGSDGLSGVTANPTVGKMSDHVVGAGGTVIFAETTEMFGTEALLAERAATPEIAESIYALIERQKAEAVEAMGPQAATAISPGNVKGGLTTIQEKSLGCIIKSGSGTITEVVDYAIAPTEKGVVVMDTPGSDIFSITGIAAGGAQIIVFTTGRGSPVGFPIAPVVKVASNSRLYNMMPDDMDFNAGRVAEGATLDDLGEELLDLVTRVASGEETSAEINKQEMLAIHSVGKVF